MSQPIVFKIDTQGNTTFLVNEHTKAFIPEGTELKRASHVLPASTLKRAWFLTLRYVFGEYGVIGDWTRTWKGPWHLDLTPAGGPDSWYFVDRSDAIDFEVDWLTKNFLGVKK